MIAAAPTSVVATSFRRWTAETRLAGRLPRIVVVGSLGKSTVARLIDEIAQSCGLRTALVVDGTVEVLGRRRGARPSSWDQAVRDLRTGSLDLAIEEVHWTGIGQLSVEAETIGMLVVSTICPDREACRLDETRAAISSLRSLVSCLPPDVASIVDADDVAFSLVSEMESRRVAVAAIRPQQPAFRRFFDEGGLGSWLDEGRIVVGHGGVERVVGPVSSFPLTLDGSSLFQIHNVMAATLAALTIGLPLDQATTTLETFTPSHAHLPRSLNLLRTTTTRVIVDRASPSWFLSPLLKTLRSLRPGRLTCVVDYPSSHPVEDLVDIGRMLARQSQAVVLIDREVGLARVMGLRAGVAQTPHPPPIIHAASLPRAIRRAMSGAGEDDLTLILSPRPELVHRLLARERIADVA